MTVPSKKEIVANLEDIQRRIWARKPYICVVVDARYDRTEFQGVGFAKVSWPDDWNDEFGINSATVRAKRDIAKQVQKLYDVF